MVSLPFLIAIRAAMKKVLSPNSDTKMALSDATKPEVKPRPLFGVVDVIVEFVVNIVAASSSSRSDEKEE